MEVRIIVGDFKLILFFFTIPRLRALGLLCVCEVQTQEVESVVFSPAPYQSLRTTAEDIRLYRFVGQSLWKNSRPFSILTLSCSANLSFCAGGGGIHVANIFLNFITKVE